VDETAGLPAGLGLRFIDIADDGDDRIQRFIEKRLPLRVGPSKAPPPPNE
jgi:hypothetical protein